MRTQAAMDNNTMSTSITDLPAPLLTHILRHLPLFQRFGHAGLVCRSFSAAATAATTDVACTVRQETVPGLQSWLPKHATQLVSLDLGLTDGRVGQRIMLDLPWAQLSRLQTLVLQRVQLQSAPKAVSATALSLTAATNNPQPQPCSSTGGSPTPLLPQLRQLELQECRLPSEDTLVQLATGSPVLTSLVVGACSVQYDGNNQEHRALIEGLQQQYPLYPYSATDIGDIRMSVSSATIACLGALPHLQHLRLQVADGSCDSCLAVTPQSLTRLELQEHRLPGASRRQGSKQRLPPPQQHQLSALQHLKLDGCTFHPSVLGAMPYLKHLHLRVCRFHLVLDGPEAVAALLQALASLSRLEHLHLDHAQLHIARPPYSAFSALTSSSQLTALIVQDSDLPLPKGVLQHVFPAGRQLPHLRHLAINAVSSGASTICVVSQDLSRIMTSCSNLETLDIGGVVDPGADISALAQLPRSCTSLTIGGAAFDQAAPTLAQLTQLSRLNLQLVDLSICARQQLTALRGLQELTICVRGSPFGVEGTLEHNESKGPVWQQLQVMCDSMQAQCNGLAKMPF